MAGGWAKDDAVQEQIDSNVEDALARVRSRMPQGESLGPPPPDRRPSPVCGSA